MRCLHHALLWMSSTSAAVLTFASPTSGAFTNNILITGYWPPTNEMVRRFSTSPTQNPDGWIGGNWEGRGYNIYSFFPEFPGGVGVNPKGNGDFEVDYQDTSEDWWRITDMVKPVAIITFSRANTSVGWEMEPATQRFRLQGESNPVGRSVPLYLSDYSTAASGERYPTNVPIASEPVGNIRNSTLPMQQIVNNVAAQMTSAQASPFIAAYNPATPDTFDFGGNYLSGYMGYLGSWYQARNLPGESNHPCWAAGHIHVGMNMTVPNATLATEISLRTLISHLNTIGPVPAPGATGLAAMGLAAMMARPRRLRESGVGSGAGA